MLYHLVTENEWLSGQEDGKHYVPARFVRDGFIHTSFAEQVLATANRKYLNREDLLVLLIDESKVRAKIVVEDLGNTGEEHPHIYGKLPLEAIVEVKKMKHSAKGQFESIPGGDHD